MVDDVLKQQITYYRARASEYDEWFYREGRYDRGSVENRAWFDEVQVVTEALGRFGVAGDVLELACGTGVWTGLLASRADSVTAVDASPEVIQINEAKLKGQSGNGGDLAAKVRFVQADLFNWEPDKTYDVIFFGFWLSHVPPERLDGFWRLVKKGLKPGGRFFFVDSLPDPMSTSKDNERPDPTRTRQQRRLNDGSSYEIIKVYYSPPQLQEDLSRKGFTATVESSGRYFLYGYGSVDVIGDLHIRPFRSGDEHAVIDLWHACDLTRPWNDPVKDIQRKLKVNPELFLVGLAGERVVASVMVGYEGHRGWVNYLAVHPDYRRQGYGRLLMQHAEVLLRELGCPKINLQVRTSNTGVIEFYRKLGYQVDDVVSLGKRLIRDD